ncbi:MAG: hypothetical protein LBH04_06245 [Tannerellaceae bacterium]|jgi:hypothetical protein|nr:hypothetical protein [Tannerellaceae bacterium]
MKEKIVTLDLFFAAMIIVFCKMLSEAFAMPSVFYRQGAFLFERGVFFMCLAPNCPSL